MKTVSLSEALKLGNKFRWVVNKQGEDPWTGIYTPGESNHSWSSEAILHAECQIIEEPREIWVGEDNGILHYYSHEDKFKLQQIYPNLKPVKFREVMDE